MRMHHHRSAASQGSRSSQLSVAGVDVVVIRKRIKHFYLRVDRQHGRVQISAPSTATQAEIAAVIAKRLAWIRAQQARVAAAPARVRSRFVSGETHYYFGEPLQLVVTEHTGRTPRVTQENDQLLLAIGRRARLADRAHAIGEWYRCELKSRIPSLVTAWQPTLGVRVAEWNVKRMRTRWGTCNTRARRIWLSLELAKFPPECLEAVVVHEMVHLLERRHNARFWKLMTDFLPDWRARQQTLTTHPAANHKSALPE